jgi:hypothetical protein
VSKEEADFEGTGLAQGAALGAEAIQTTQMLASESFRPQTSEAALSKPKVAGELTDAQLEDELLQGDDKSGTGEVDDEEVPER